MIRRNAPMIAFLFVFIAMLYFIYSVPRYEPIVEAEENEKEEPVNDTFRGRVDMPSTLCWHNLAVAERPRLWAQGLDRSTPLLKGRVARFSQAAECPLQVQGPEP